MKYQCLHTDDEKNHIALDSTLFIYHNKWNII